MGSASDAEAPAVVKALGRCFEESALSLAAADLSAPDACGVGRSSCEIGRLSAPRPAADDGRAAVSWSSGVAGGSLASTRGDVETFSIAPSPSAFEVEAPLPAPADPDVVERSRAAISAIAGTVRVRDRVVLDFMSRRRAVMPDTDALTFTARGVDA